MKLPQRKIVALALNPFSTAASKEKRGGEEKIYWGRTIARSTWTFCPLHDVVRPEYLPESKRPCKMG